jgi:hypothetical protein
MPSSTKTTASAAKPPPKIQPAASHVQSSAPPADVQVAAFQAWLDPKDRLIHELATQMLKTRYTPQRSNKWQEWLKSGTKH